MYTGWMRAFKVNRPLLPEERCSVLSREAQPDVEPNQRMGMIRINSSYIDWIDRRFLFRGNMKTLLASVGYAYILYLSFNFLVWRHFATPGELNSGWWVDCIGFAICLSIIFFAYWVTLGREYFTYTHWPIRFNRRAGMVHVFRHSGPNGTLTVPWNQVFFHVGCGTTDKELRDIRGEVMDGNTVTDTFALGHAAPNETPVREMWEFIRRYMDEGPEAVACGPLDKYVELSVTSTLKNCYLFAYTYYGASVPRVFRVFVIPFVWLSTLTRWLVFLTCRHPAFPPEIEAACRVDADDPNVWPIPASAGQFARDVPGLIEHAREKAERRLAAAHKQAREQNHSS